MMHHRLPSRGTSVRRPGPGRRATLGRLPAGLLLAWLLLWGGPRVALAGAIHSKFDRALRATPQGEMRSGLVLMSQQLDLGELDRRAEATGAVSRWRRHQEVVVAAQSLAADTQSPLLRELQDLRDRGLVRSFRSFWISNLIEVEALPEVFRRLADRADVGVIFENSKIDLRLGRPAEGPVPPQGIASLPDNLICVNVEPVWSEGLRGQGRIVAIFDTGVKGDHEALIARWRGSYPGIPWSWAWFDPYSGTQYPYDYAWHGTHVAGIMVGEKPDGTPIGVAPRALWIAAALMNHYSIAQSLQCYEWVVDPDGDPGTISDVPDVVNNSWGRPDDCDSTYWNAIDVAEAAGIVNTIAVDNTGPAPFSVNSPESRATSASVNFCVGNVDPHQPGYPIHATSGRGPSPCDSSSIKPELSAPGTLIYSCLGNGSYGNLTGASMACPHVSGAVAILRQINPDLTVEQIKTALMETALDRGEPGEDNTYGWGILDVTAAADWVRDPLPSYPPQGLGGEVVSDSVLLAWSPPLRVFPAHPLQAYRVYRTPVGEPFPLEPIAELDSLALTTAYVDTGLVAGVYHYVVTSVYDTVESGPSNEVEITIEESLSGLTARASDPRRLQPGPNPFTAETIIRFASDGEAPARLEVFDASGARVRSLVSGRAILPAGESATVWDGRDDAGRRLPAGVYFLRLEEAGRTFGRSVTLLR